MIRYADKEDGHWHSIVESALDDGMSNRDAATDILAMVDAINALSPAAKAELDKCDLQEFNIGLLGLHCGDT